MASARKRGRSRPAEAKGVQFGTVSVQEFKRMVGGPGIPRSGSWPLALSHPAGPPRVVGTVDEYESHRHTTLAARAAALPHPHRALANGETRQFDFKSATVPENPLFGRLGSESARQAHLLSCLDAGIVDVGGDSLHTDAAEAHAELSTLRTFGPEGIQCVCTCVSVRVQARDWPIAKLRAQLASHKLGGKGSKEELLARCMACPEIVKQWADTPVCNPGSCSCLEAEIECVDECDCRSAKCANPLGTRLFDSKAVSEYRRGVLAGAAPRGRGGLARTGTVGGPGWKGKR